MKAARLHTYSDLSNIKIESVVKPEPGPNEVLIRVVSASINPLDIKLVTGSLHGFFPLSFPYTLGTDLAGIVEQSGPLAARWRPGDKVIARADPRQGGAFAEYVVVPATHITSAPTCLTLEEGSALPTVAGVAWQALFDVANLKSGQTILIHAGAGGVGSLAIQLARIADTRVIATASSSHINLVRQLGADDVIDYKVEDFSDRLRDVDVVLDTVGGDTQQKSFTVLHSGGFLASVISPPDEALAKAHKVTASFVFHETDSTRLNLIAGLCDAGSLQAVIDRKFPLAETRAAMSYLMEGHARGKVLLVP
ncbi:NADPH:quinone reductase [Reticulibacter mediterranei]|uniref:NADPH:quinone reductase n=1 Tax=Reticulibacter mediterranei TaxID=2778369 RepID=A0A8J3IXU1_9CHLR|nr:NADP-dependent oxidoreductase [Reticulibacter mediterranei]GHO98041.1 NADPH:quinone reductase [Reticulibacter mediterranei]